MSVSDSTDWLLTPLAALSPLDAALRCQVCKDFFTTPMITSCSHTFCSLCIRRCLSQDGRCPVCREQDQEMKLRRNWVVEELVANFAQSREGLLDFAMAVVERGQQDDFESQHPKKRRKLNGGSTQLPERRSTRSQSQRDATEVSQESGTTAAAHVVDDSEDVSTSEYEGSQPSPIPISRPEREDGLVSCPVCGKRMKEQTVYSHLDICTGTSSDATSPPANDSGHGAIGSIAYTLPNTTKQKDRLPTINYAMLGESHLRKKLKELGIPNLGPKLLLQKRHTEWLNLWNANCDSRKPRTKRELLEDLNTWERTQGRQIANNAGPNGVMVKEFDRVAYARSNRSDFDELIRKAREKKSVAKPETSGMDPSVVGDTSSKLLQETSVPPAVSDESESNVSVQEAGILHQETVVSSPQDGQDNLGSMTMPALEPTQSQGSMRSDIAV